MSEPLIRTIFVECDIEHTFNVFTQRIDQWWPQGHRRLRDSTLYLETTQGGRFFEKTESGEEFKLGDVLECERPSGISFSWFLGAIKTPTRVDISFQANGEGTFVTVRHSEAESALGDLWPQRVSLFEKGWTAVFAAFISHLREEDNES